MKVKIDHVNISVADLNKSIEWYGKIFGFEPVERGKSSTGKEFAIVANNDSMICMTEFKGKTAADKNDDESSYRIYHFGLRVEDVERWRAVLQEFKLQLYYGGEIEYPFSRSWYVHDPSGHEIEVNYTAEERLQFPAIKSS